MKIIYALFLTVFYIANPIATIAQGCSDAGFCSLQYHPQKTNTLPKNIVTIGNVIGSGDGNTFVNSTYIQYSKQLSKNIFWDTKVLANYVSGALAGNLNIGDIITTISATISKPSQKNIIKLLGGIKIPLTVANDKAAGKPLPMAYQTSLGTFDALVGILVVANKWEFTNAYQIPLMYENKNTFLKEFSTATDFPSTNQFNRKSDVLLRAAYNISTHKKIDIKPNVLAIYHVANDTYVNAFGNRVAIENSQGLTLNANIIAGMPIHKKNRLEISLATPLVVRTVRPDGLTRSFTAGVEYKILF